MIRLLCTVAVVIAVATATGAVILEAAIEFGDGRLIHLDDY